MKTFILNSIAVFFTAACTTAFAQSDTPLGEVDSIDFDELYLAESVSMPITKKVFVMDAEVAFADVWVREFRTRTSKNYQNRIKKKYGETIRSFLIEELEKAGWDVESKKTAETILISPKLINLNIYAPKEPGIKAVIVRTAGRASLDLTFSAPDGTPFMKIVDHRETRQSIGSPIVANRASNYRYFKLMMEEWAEWTVPYLRTVMDLVEQQTK